MVNSRSPPSWFDNISLVCSGQKQQAIHQHSSSNSCQKWQHENNWPHLVIYGIGGTEQLSELQINLPGVDPVRELLRLFDQLTGLDEADDLQVDFEDEEVDDEGYCQYDAFIYYLDW